MLIPALLLLVGIALLWGSAEWLVRGAAILSSRAGISPIVIGLTVVSIGTSLPELVVSLAAALSGNTDLAVGNVLGSNLANLGLILGVAAIVRPLRVHAQVVRREVPWMVLLSVLLLPLSFNLRMGRIEGTVLLALLVTYIYLMAPMAKEAEKQVLRPVPELEPTGEKGGYVRPVLFVVAGAIGLVIGGRSIVGGATEIAAILGVPNMIVGLSVVAVGTSLPELATSVVAALRDEADLAVGNVVGSNIFNLTFVLGTTALASPFDLSPETLRIEYPAVMVLSLFLLPLTWTTRRLGRLEGMALVGLYAGAWMWILLSRGI
jgi:cation:H+ antiporter